MKPRVWIADKLSEKALEVFRARGIEAIYAPALSEEEKLRLVEDVDGIAVRSATKVKGELLARAKRLKVVGRAGIGVDNIDVETCSRRGIVVMNTPHGNAVTTAELAVAMICAAARMIPQANASTKAGKWEKQRFLGVELTGKTAGVIGAGNIGAIVCERLRGLGMQVIVYDPFISDERAEALGVEKVESLKVLVERADVITVHVPLTAQTRHLINGKLLAHVKPGAILVNCARGGVVDEKALAEALQTGRLRAAAVDVYETEPPPADHPLLQLDNCICTPHIGASTVEAQENVAVQIAEQMADYLLLGVVRNAVNMPSLSEEERRRLAPFLRLARALGRFAGEALGPGYARVRIALEGDAARIQRRLVVHELLCGLLQGVMDEVNAVNAPMIARERGIVVEETAREESGSFRSLVRLSVEGDGGAIEVAGALFDGVRPRIVLVDGCELEAAPEGEIVFIRNRDRPGVIADVGRALAEAGINIADFRLGRRAPGGEAVALVRVDAAPSEEVLAKIAALPDILRVRRISLG